MIRPYPKVPPEGYQSIPGWCNFDHIYAERVEEASSAAPSTFVEIGTAFGRSAAFMGHCIRASGKPIILHSIDTFDESALHPDIASFLAFHRQDQEHAMSMEALARWYISQCGLCSWVNVVRDSGPVAAANHASGSIDFCFIDGDHEYESVKADILAWWPKMKYGCWLGGHDYGMQSVFTAVNDTLKLPVIVRHDVWMVNKV